MFHCRTAVQRVTENMRLLGVKIHHWGYLHTLIRARKQKSCLLCVFRIQVPSQIIRRGYPALSKLANRRDTVWPVLSRAPFQGGRLDQSNPGSLIGGCDGDRHDFARLICLALREWIYILQESQSSCLGHELFRSVCGALGKRQWILSGTEELWWAMDRFPGLGFTSGWILVRAR